jgi:hypothetical protein
MPVCSGCSADLARSAFSQAQLRAGAGKRCKACQTAALAVATARRRSETARAAAAQPAPAQTGRGGAAEPTGVLFWDEDEHVAEMRQPEPAAQGEWLGLEPAGPSAGGGGPRPWGPPVAPTAARPHEPAEDEDAALARALADMCAFPDADTQYAFGFSAARPTHAKSWSRGRAAQLRS